MIIVPIHVSGIWVPVRGGDPLTSGSIGAGLIIGEARVELGGVSAMVNGEDVGDLGEPRCGGFSISSPAPLGYGFAVSAIVALAAELTCGGPLTAAARAAHVREVLRGTGLGDVLAIYTGGCLVHRYVPGAPGIGAAEPMPCPRLGVVAVAARRVETRAMLAEYARFRELAAEAYKRFARDPTMETFVEAATAFLGKFFGEPPSLGLPKHCVYATFTKKGAHIWLVERGCVDEAFEAASRLGHAMAGELAWRSIAIT